MSEDPTQQNDIDQVIKAKADCIHAGLDLTGPCGAIRITNLVAWRLGYKLLGKTGGNRACLRPDMSCVEHGEPGFADGYIIHLPTGYGVDILVDAGGANKPAWQVETTKVERNLRDWKEPLFDEATMDGAPPDPPEPPDPDDPELERRVTDLEAAVLVLGVQVQGLTELHEEAVKQIGTINGQVLALTAMTEVLKQHVHEYSLPIFGVRRTGGPIT